MVIYGDKPRKMVPELLDAVGLAGELKKEYTIGLKPNLAVARNHHRELPPIRSLSKLL